MTLATLAANWLDHCAAEGKLASTMHGYRYAIQGILLPYCEREGIVEMMDLDQQALNALNRELLTRTGRKKGEPISKYTVDAYLRPIRHFVDWAHAEGYDVAGRPLLPRIGRPKPKDVLNRDEIHRMEDACRSERDKLIVRVLGDTGMRIQELLRLRPEDLIERNRQWFLYVRGKGENDRFVPVPRVWRRLKTWIERGRPQPCADLIFVSKRGPGYYAGLRYSGAYEVVRNAATDAGVTKRTIVHPHLLRHSFITELRKRGHNDAQISMVVGNFSRLQAYTWLQPGDAYGLVASLD